MVQDNKVTSSQLTIFHTQLNKNISGVTFKFQRSIPHIDIGLDGSGQPYQPPSAESIRQMLNRDTDDESDEEASDARFEDEFLNKCYIGPNRCHACKIASNIEQVAKRAAVRELKGKTPFPSDDESDDTDEEELARYVIVPDPAYQEVSQAK